MTHPRTIADQREAYDKKVVEAARLAAGRVKEKETKADANEAAVAAAAVQAANLANESDSSSEEDGGGSDDSETD
jgi:hypothetical protein